MRLAPRDGSQLQKQRLVSVSEQARTVMTKLIFLNDITQEDRIKIEISAAKAAGINHRLEQADHNLKYQSGSALDFPAISARMALVGLRGLTSKIVARTKDARACSNRGGITTSAGSSRMTCK
jgi:hypothetical protein